MILRPLTNGAVVGTDTLQVKSGVVGGALLTADGTNDATLIVRRESDTGKAILHVVSKIPLWITGPFHLEGALLAYVSVAGAGARRSDRGC